ncbi:HAMP domain-containing protein [Herbaspirillum frisingense]|uniref:methyl-accepting chemotaxis protein n=1 Tax=Herbaspirillum frisingense TaxID=92645 RepID=UPI001602C1E0|nr:methyl-accepting chemotaxis protein [Herbaspirillum frisingense]QNB06110.1 HAMP domain-containing protein [Herbaspirillum frisingense]
MNLLRNLRLRTRLSAGFAILLLLLVIITGLGVSSMSFLNTTSTTLSSEIYPKVNSAQKLLFLMMDIARAARNVIILDDEGQMAIHVKSFETNRVEIDRTLQFLLHNTADEHERELITSAMEASKSYLAFTSDVVALGLANQNREGQQLLFGPRYKTQGELLAILQEIVAHFEGKMNDATRAAQGTYVSSATMLAIAAAIAILLGIVAALLITRSITVPMAEAVDAARKVANGDLTKDIRDDSRDETGELLAALREMNRSLVKIVANVRTGANTIATASQEIAAGNQDLSARTEHQASSLGETASSMEELTSTVQQNSANSRQAAEMARAASGIADQGGELIGQVVRTMDDIEASARRIVDIISAIDGIAFQTNILALNAAVEAARAGEQGRGFAVVATEVRNLAQRSAAAAKEIKVLIGDSVEKVDSGAHLVKQAGQTMLEIVKSVAQVNAVIGQISTAGEEQRAGIEQVNQAITQMDQVTQQNAVLVEEAAATSHAMQNQAVQLTEQVSIFQLPDDAMRELQHLSPPNSALSGSYRNTVSVSRPVPHLDRA